MKPIFRFIAMFFAIVVCSVSFSASGAQSVTSKIDTVVEFQADVFETQEYVIKKGDTLSALGVRTDEKYLSIAKRNNIKDPDVIRDGQIITLKRGVSEVLRGIAHVKKDIATIQEGLRVMHGDLSAVKDELALAQVKLADKSTYLLSASIGLFGFSALFIGYIFIQSKKIKKQHNEIFAQKRQIKSLEESNRAAHHLVQVHEKEIASLKTALRCSEAKMIATEQLLKKCDPNGDFGVPEIIPEPEQHNAIVSELTTGTLPRLGKSMHHC